MTSDIKVINKFPHVHPHDFKVIYHNEKQPGTKFCSLGDSSRDITPFRGAVNFMLSALSSEGEEV